VDEVLGEEHTPGLCHCYRRGAEMLNKESPEVAFAEAQAFREHFNAGVVSVKRSVRD
jgi:hypothetical protein